MYGYRSCEKWVGKNVHWTWLKTLRTLFGLRNVVGGWLCASTRQYYTAGIQMTAWMGERILTDVAQPWLGENWWPPTTFLEINGVRIILLGVLPYVWSFETDLFSGKYGGYPTIRKIYTAPSPVITMVAPTSSERGWTRAVCIQIPKIFPRPD